MACPDGCFTLNQTLSIALYFTVIGFKFLLFSYFLLIRFRKTKRMYWLYFSLFFIFLAASRVFYLMYDFFFGVDDKNVAWRFANTAGWLSVAMLSGILSTLLFTGDSKLHQIIKKVFPLVPVGIAVFILFFPDIWINDPAGFFGWGGGKLVLNVAILPIYIVLLPFMFFYLAKKSAGTLQRSFLLNGIGLFLYYVVRAVQPVLAGMTGSGTAMMMPPLLILLAILVITFANQYESLK
ncbi:MAG: hypothetical protein JW839_01165 [Candidatus Lokiarchaeota archaeon]|nr:hypothetical protein [Candidatus Lokiarchaeota archaeon]